MGFALWARWALATVLVVTASVGLAPFAQAVSCSTEQQKFIGSTNNAYGGMGTMYAYNRSMDSCGSVANTVFVYLSVQNFSYIEAGTRQFGTNSGTFITFTEWADYPASASYYPGSTNYVNDQHISFAVTPNSNTTWKSQFNWDGNEAGPWFGMSTSPVMISDHGSPQSEISHYGNASAVGSNKDLKYRPGSGWTLWTNLSCSAYFPNTITDYDATKVSNSWWKSQAGTPPPGDC